MKFWEYVKVIVLSAIVFILSGGVFYACQIMPMEECTDQGHSFAYCYKLLNRN